MDNFFTSLALPNKLLAIKPSQVGTMNKVRWELPPSVQNKAPAQPLYSTMVLKNVKTTLTLYQCKARKNASVMSTMHLSVAIDGDTIKRKPDTVMHHNQRYANITSYASSYIDKRMQCVILFCITGVVFPMGR